MSLDQPIVVTGGSVTLDFNDGVIKKEGGGKYHNKDKKIRRVEVVDDSGKTIFAQDVPNGKVKVTIHIGS